MQNTFWRDAAKGGIIIGAVLVAFGCAETLLAATGKPTGMLLSIAELAALAALLYKFGKRRATTQEGYSYGQSMGFTMALMLLAGFIFGIGQYLIVNFMAPGVADTMADAMVETARTLYGNQMAEGMASVAGRMFSSPLFWVFSGVVGMMFYGGLVGLFVSAFVRRRPEPDNTQL